MDALWSGFDSLLAWPVDRAGVKVTVMKKQ
jgi:hypothetical protein